MRIQHLSPERVPRSGVLKGSFILLRSSVAPTVFCSTLDSITVPKYKKSSTPSTMTALHVVLPPPAPRHVDISLCQALALALMPFPMTSPAHEHVHTPSPPLPFPPLHHRTQTHNIGGFFAPPHGATLPCCLLSIRFVPVTPSRFISYPNARNTSPP